MEDASADLTHHVASETACKCPKQCVSTGITVQFVQVYVHTPVSACWFMYRHSSSLHHLKLQACSHLKPQLTTARNTSCCSTRWAHKQNCNGKLSANCCSYLPISFWHATPLCRTEVEYTPYWVQTVVPLVPAVYALALSPVTGAGVVRVEAWGEAVFAGLGEEMVAWPVHVPGTQFKADSLHTWPEPHAVRYVAPLEHCTNLVQSHGSAWNWPVLPWQKVSPAAPTVQATYGGLLQTSCSVVNCRCVQASSVDRVNKP